MINQTRYFTTARKELNSILDFITDALASFGLDPKACSRTRFRSEDLAVMLMDHASEGSRLKVTVRKTLGTTTVRMVCGGTEFNYQEALKDLFADALDEETKILVYEKLLKHYEQDVIVTRKGNLNVVTITVARRKKNQMLIAAATVLLGIAAGLAVKLIFPENTALYVADHIFGTGTRLFLNAIKMVVPFLVFFSIASGISGFGDLRDLGRIFFRVNGLCHASDQRIVPLQGVRNSNVLADAAIAFCECVSAFCGGTIGTGRHSPVPDRFAAANWYSRFRGHHCHRPVFPGVHDADHDKRHKHCCVYLYCGQMGENWLRTLLRLMIRGRFNGISVRPGVG